MSFAPDQQPPPSISSKSTLGKKARESERKLIHTNFLSQLKQLQEMIKVNMLDASGYGDDDDEEKLNKARRKSTLKAKKYAE